MDTEIYFPVENIQLEYELGFQLDIHLESQQEFQLYLLFLDNPRVGY